jgi:hypothetical protein
MAVFCIYASIDIDNSKNMPLIDSLSSRIINYEENIQNENLEFINFRPYYESALKGNLTLFEELKMPYQRIVFTTTHPLSKINTVVDSFEIVEDDILVKLFSFRNLLSTIKPSTTTK